MAVAEQFEPELAAAFRPEGPGQSGAQVVDIGAMAREPWLGRGFLPGVGRLREPVDEVPRMQAVPLLFAGGNELVMRKVARRFGQPIARLAMMAVGNDQRFLDQ